MVEDAERWHIVGRDPYMVLTTHEVYYLVDSVLAYLSDDGFSNITVASILSNQTGIIPTKYLTQDMIEFALKVICVDGKISQKKVAKVIALGLLSLDDRPELQSFLKDVEARLEMLLPADVFMQDMTSQKELFEGINSIVIKPKHKAILDNLHGHAVIIPDQQVCIKLVDPYFSPNLNACDSIDICFAILFMVKDKWTL